MQAYFLVSDDIMDYSLTRRGELCWYRCPHVRLIAIKDCPIVKCAIYRLLRAHFYREPYYIDLVKLFDETMYQTRMGQLLDLLTAPENKVDLNKFSSERYVITISTAIELFNNETELACILHRHRLIVIYKTAYYSFYLPSEHSYPARERGAAQGSR